MAALASKGEKRKIDNLLENDCILCGKECDEDKSDLSLDAWNSVKSCAQKWIGLDRFTTVHETVNWENGPKGVYFHKWCRVAMANAMKLQQAVKRKMNKDAETSNDISVESSVTLTSPQRFSRSNTGILHSNELCVWCMKPDDKKHPERNQWYNISSKDAWNAFKGHTIFLEKGEMRDRILKIIDSTTDPFATEIHYHETCWKRYTHRKYDYDLDEFNLH